MMPTLYHGNTLIYMMLEIKKPLSNLCCFDWIRDPLVLTSIIYGIHHLRPLWTPGVRWLALKYLIVFLNPMAHHQTCNTQSWGKKVRWNDKGIDGSNDVQCIIPCFKSIWRPLSCNNLSIPFPYTHVRQAMLVLFWPLGRRSVWPAHLKHPARDLREGLSWIPCSSGCRIAPA